jgi:mRNA interferase MazF
MAGSDAPRRRGDVVTVVLSRDYGKPRPALVIQSDLFDAHPPLTVLPLTTDLRPTPLFRIDITPTQQNGLRAPSQVMVDKAQTLPRGKIGQRVGALSVEEMICVDRALALFLGFA